MNEEKLIKLLRGLLRDEFKWVKEKFESIERRLDKHDIGLKAINQRLDDPDTGLKAINQRLDANTGSLIQIESEFKAFGDAYKMNHDHIERLDTRLHTTEKELGITPSEELLVPHFN